MTQFIACPINIYQKFIAYAKNVPDCTSGLGRVIQTKTGDFELKEIKLFKQSIPEGISPKNEEPLTAGLLEQSVSKDDFKSGWALWWHVHKDQGLHWTNRDMDSIKNIADFF